MLLRNKRARVVAGIVVFVLCGVFVPPWLTQNRFKREVAGAISDSIGHKVRFDRIEFRLLPQPGFAMERFVVEDDPAFSAEPLLRAEEVVAQLRLSSLWRARLEIARLSLTDPSLNLVRNERGEWNLESVLVRAASVPAAPTAKLSPEARPRFPYIEADGGRINLKLGNEKKAYALSEADFALWLASENEWRMRLEARPVRTDANLSDTGEFRLEGSAVRGATLRDTALRFDYSWENAQLGNLSQLAWGRDRGWRGAAAVNGSVAGTLRELLLSTRTRVADFRRYDIMAGDELNLDLRCSARYLGDTQTLSTVDCRLPVGNGEVVARGMVSGLLGDRRWELSISATAVPAAELLRALRHAKKDMADLTVSGALDAAFTYRPLAGRHAWSGGGSTTVLRFSGRPLTAPFEVAPIRFALGPVPDPLFQQARAPGSPFFPKLRPQDQPVLSRLTIAPMSISLGGAAPAALEARFDRESYVIGLHGDSELARATSIATAFGFRPPQTGATGGARLDLVLNGDWHGFAPPLVTGSALLRNVRAEIKGVNAPVEVAGGLLVFTAAGVDALNVAASFPDAGVALRGDLHLPRGCSNLLNCPVRFALTAPALNLDDLNRLLNPRFHPQPWYRFFVGSTPTTGLRRLEAQGTLATPRLLLKSAVVTRFSARLRLAGGRLVLQDVAGDLYGGKHRGEWSADFSGNAPVYNGTGTITGADLALVSAAMRDGWSAGRLSGSYKFSASGDTAAELAASALGDFEFDWRNGVLHHVALRGAAPLRLRRFTGALQLRDARLTFAAGRMETPEGIYTVSGSSSFARTLDLKLEGAAHSYLVTGTLAQPRVTMPPATEAALKP